MGFLLALAAVAGVVVFAALVDLLLSPQAFARRRMRRRRGYIDRRPW